MAVTGMMLIVTVFCGIVALFVFHFRRRRLYIEAAKYPGPPTIPIIGNARYFFGEIADIVDKTMQLTKVYSSPYRIWQGPRLFLMVHEPAQIKAILSNPTIVERSVESEFMRPLFGTGLVTAPGNLWRRHRKLIAPAFNPKILGSFVDKFAKHSEIMVKHMEKELQCGEFDVYNYIWVCTLDTICETSLGVELNLRREEKHRLIKTMSRSGEISALRVVKVWLRPDFIFYLSKLGKEQRGLSEYFYKIMSDVIKSMKNNHRNQMRLTNDARQKSRFKVFSEILTESLENDMKFTEKEFRDEVHTMTITGSETSAIVLRFTILMLANYPEVQERVYQELCEIDAGKDSSDTSIKIEDLDRMQYLKRVIKETLRLFPAVPFLPRKITEDVDLGDHILPEGCTVIIPIINVHRSEKYWPDPLKFDPDRFLPEEVEKRHPFCYLPFGAGPRSCIGYKYAIMSMQVILATLLRRYVLKTNKFVKIEDVELDLDIALKHAKPIMIKISERCANASSNET